MHRLVQHENTLQMTNSSIAITAVPPVRSSISKFSNIFDCAFALASVVTATFLPPPSSSKSFFACSGLSRRLGVFRGH